MMNNSYQDRLRMMANYRASLPYQREGMRLKSGSKELMQEPTDNGLLNALDKYKYHTLKSRGYQRN